MSNLVEFIVKMRDMASGGMQKMASTAQSAFNKVDNSMARTVAKMRRPAQSIDMLNTKLDNLRKTRDLSINTSQIRAANREIDRVERRLNRMENAGRRSSGSSGSSGGGILGMLGSTRGLVAGAGIAALVAGGGTALSSGMQAGAQKTSFEVMGGKQQGGALFNDLTKFAQDSIFGNELYQDAQTMLAFGATVKDVMPDLRMLGDVSMGNKERLGALTLAFSQVRAAGKLTGQDLLQFVNAGFNPLQVMSEKTGRSMAQLRDDVSNGLVTFDMVKKSFQMATSEGGKFFNMTNKIAETPFGKWEALKGQIQGVGMQLGTAMLPMASKVIDVLGNLASNAPAMINSLAPVFNTLGELIDPIMSLVPSAMQMIKPIVDMIAAMPIKGLIMDIVGFGQALFAGIAPILVNLQPLISTIVDVVFDLTHKIFELAKPVINILSPALSGAAKILSFVLAPALKLVGGFIGGIIDAITWVVDKLAALIKPISALMDLIGDGVNALMDGITGEAASKKAYEGAKQVGQSWYTGYMDGIGKPKPFDFGASGAAGREAIAQREAGNTKAGSSGFGNLTGGNNTSDKITGGGSKTINITVHKMLDSVVINAQNVSEGVNDLERKVEEALFRILQSANAI